MKSNAPKVFDEKLTLTNRSVNMHCNDPKFELSPHNASNT